MAELDPKEYAQWNEEIFHKAATQIGNREEAVLKLLPS